jgi:hypothetical protein
MKKLLLIGLLALFPSLAQAQCNGIFAPNTLCGNNTASPRTPFAISSSTGVVGPGSTTINDLVLWNSTNGTITKDQAPGALSAVNDTNVTATLGGAFATSLVNAASITLGWSGTLAAARLNANVVQSIVNDTNVTGSISAQALTLGWTGTLAAARLNANVVQAFTNDTNIQASITAQNATLAWAGQLSIARGGTGAATQSAAASAVLPTPVNPGDVLYWSGSVWVTLAGNTSGTQVLQENSSGVPSWVTVSGTGTVTAITQGAGMTFSVAPCTSSCTITNAQLESPQGRLTLTANTPVMTVTAAAQTTLRYDCYVGSRVPYFDGSVDQTDTIASCEVTDAMVSAASAGQVVNNNVYDVWWVHGGANRICLAMSAAAGGAGGWASDTSGTNTARGTGYTQLDRVTRPYTTNKNSITHCFNAAVDYGPVSANQGTYLGTVYASANGQVSFTFGASASGGTAALLGVWNMYNRVTVGTTVTDSGATYTYTPTTIRQARASAGNQITYLAGVYEDSVTASYSTRVNTANATGAGVAIGIGVDSTTTFFSQRGTVNSVGTTGIVATAAAAAQFGSGFGIHIISANEQSDGTNANVFDGDLTAVFIASFRM